MIFQAIASAVLGFLVVYAFLQARTTAAIAVTVLAIAAAGEYLVLFPDAATTIANHVGIGRGADLVFYLWGLVTAVVLLNVHLRFRATNERYVALVREIALDRFRAELSERASTGAGERARGSRSGT